jgi:hypothetical protein
MHRLSRSVAVQQIATAMLLPLLAGCASYPRVPVSGYLAGKPIATTVDGKLARDYFVGSLPGNDRKIEQRIAALQQNFQARPLTPSLLQVLSKQTSPDFATLFFIEQSLANKVNARFQASYVEETKRVQTIVRQSSWTGIVPQGAARYRFLFVPGFHYVSDPASGADFLYQRQFMHELGYDVQLILTKEDGTVQENAAIIARTIRAESKPNAKLILISTSKAGPETALALGKLLPVDQTAAVKAWISVGGLIRGTRLADRATVWPRSWLTKIIFAAERIDYRSLPDLTTTASIERLKEIRLPRHILLVEFIAAPLSGDVADDVKRRYRSLRRYGPNDGLTLLADELLPDGITIFEPGLDHFYRDPDINQKSLALANVVVNELGGRGARLPSTVHSPP